MEQENETPQIDEIVKLPYKRKSRAKPKKEIEVIPQSEIDEQTEIEDEPIIESTEYDTFLDEMCNEPVEQEENIVYTQYEDEPIKKPRKSRAKKPKTDDEHKNINDMENEELYADDATPILGKDRLQVIKKIESYKILFKDELKNFKLAKNPTIDMLEMALAEIETIIELGTIDSFITDSIIQCIKLTEGASSYTKYNLTGLSALLKENKQFHNLLKQLYLKHKVFSEVPPEYQLLMLVTTTGILCVQKNSSKNQMNDRLNEPMVF
jgi:hypothetical protein